MLKTTAPRTCYEREEDGECQRDVTNDGYCYRCETYRCCDCGMEVVSAPATKCGYCAALPAEHTTDADCVGHVDSDGNCTVCRAGGGDPCPACGGVRYHAAGCKDACANCEGGGCNNCLPEPYDPETDTAGVPLPVGDEDTAPVEEETRREVTTWDPAAGRLVCARAA